MNEVEWGLFEVEDVFEIVTGALLKASDLEKGLIPRITATSVNNGISTFTSEMTHKNFRKFENFISVSFLGDVFYQPNEVSLDMKIHGLKLKDRVLTEPLSLYLIPLIKKFSRKYAYGNQLSTSVLARQKLSLPIKTDGTPDWEYMENYIESLEAESLERTVQFLRDELAKVGDSKEVALNNANWQIYIIEDIIDISNGVRLTSADMNEGVRPFIGATEYNNGITNYVSNTNKSQDSNVLGINYNGSVCEGFYHQYEAIFSDDVKRLKFKEGINNEYTLHFLLTVVEKQRKKYQYGYKFNTTRMKNQKIMLPATLSSEPDYEFMENYIKGIKYDSIMKALNFIEDKNKDAK